VIAQMSSEQAVETTIEVSPKQKKWPRGIRLAVALVFATVSWIVVVGAGYLIVQIL
jgi:hypothetical protein